MKLKTLDGVEVENGDWAWYILLRNAGVVRNLVEWPTYATTTVGCYSTERAALLALELRIRLNVNDAEESLKWHREHHQEVLDRLAALEEV